MYIAIKNNKNFDPDDIKAITSYLVSQRFQRQMKIDLANKDDDQTRSICEISKNYFIVRHSEFAIQSIEDASQELHLSSVERYGLLDIFQLGTDANKTATLYWIIATKAKIVQPTGLGLICKNSYTNSGEAKPYARFDRLWCGGSNNSTVFLIERSSHMIT